MTANFLDRAILAVAPMWGARRLAVRRLLAADAKVQERFARVEAAENSHSRADKWLISRLSPDSQFEQDMATFRDRSRDLYQNDALGGVIEDRVNHVVGVGHTPQSRIRAVDGLVDEGQAAELNDAIEALYEQWSMRADRTGRKSLWRLSRLVERHNAFDGESFTVLSDVGRADKPIPLALQVIDPERVNTPPKFASDANVRLGIRQSDDGDILGYYVQRQHPGDTKKFSLEYDYIPADRMLHVYEEWFAGQSRGFPWMVRALNRAKDAKDVDEAAILGAQIEQCYAAFVKQQTNAGALAALGLSTGTTSSGELLQDITPGTITYLNPGEEVTFGSPARPGNTLEPFLKWNYRRVAAAINWPYEMITKDWAGLSFAAGRLVLTAAKKATECHQKVMREQWFSRVWGRMVEEAVLVGEVAISPAAFLSRPHAFTRHCWIAPKWEYALNPGEEVKADVEEVDQNLALLEDKLGKRGYDLEEFIERRKREKQLIADAGLEPTPKPGAAAPTDAAPGEPVDDEPTDDEPVDPAEQPEEEGAVA